MVAYSPLSLAQLPVGSRIEIFDAGTVTPKSVFQDRALSAAHPRPILVPADGFAPSIWTTGADYRARIIRPDGTLLRDIDGIAGDVGSGGGGGGGGGSSQWTTGDIKDRYDTGVHAGWVRANARTIGSAVSGASERANDDCYDLFSHLWNKDVSLTVSGGRSATADDDWAANKTIALPDFRFRARFGMDDMGNSVSGRASGVTFAAGTATTLGSVGGTGVVTLTLAQLAAHTHDGTTSTKADHQHLGTTADKTVTITGDTSDDGAHSHGGNTSGGGQHNHGGGTSSDGNHAHGGSTGGASASHTHDFTQHSTTSVNNGTGSFTNVASASTVTATTGIHSNDHTHGIGADGTHSHTIPLELNHTHPIPNQVAHHHSINITSGSHSHTFTTDPGGSHNHTFTTDTAGLGGAHNNMPPFMLVTVYIKL